MSIHRLTFSIHYQDLLALEISIDWGRTAPAFSRRSINLVIEEHQTRRQCIFFLVVVLCLCPGKNVSAAACFQWAYHVIKNLVAGHLGSVSNLHCALIGSKYKILFRCINMCRYNEAKTYLSQLNFINNARGKKKNDKFHTCDKNLDVLHTCLLHFKRYN